MPCNYKFRNHLHAQCWCNHKSLRCFFFLILTITCVWMFFFCGYSDSKKWFIPEPHKKKERKNKCKRSLREDNLHEYQTSTCYVNAIPLKRVGKFFWDGSFTLSNDTTLTFSIYDQAVSSGRGNGWERAAPTTEAENRPCGLWSNTVTGVSTGPVVRPRDDA